MIGEEIAIAEYLREFGIYFVLAWFMLRVERLLKNNTLAINDLKLYMKERK